MEQKIVYVTNHAEERFNERLYFKSLSKKVRQARLAYERGIGKNDSSGVAKRLIDYIVYTESKEGCVEVKIYAGALYVFGLDGALITVYKLDKEFSKLYEGARRKINRRNIAA